MFLDAVRDNYEEWESKTNCKIIAIAGQKIDKSVLDLINKKQWPCEVYFDPEYDLFRALSRHHNKNDVRFAFPTTFVFNGNWEMLDKINGIKRKFKDGIVPTGEFKVTMDMLEIDLKAYYEMCDRYKNNNAK